MDHGPSDGSNVVARRPGSPDQSAAARCRPARSHRERHERGQSGILTGTRSPSDLPTPGFPLREDAVQNPIPRKTGRFPWYDSLWLASYLAAKEFVREHYPHRLTEFVDAFDVLRTDPGFRVRTAPDLLDDTARDGIIDIIRNIKNYGYEKHELLRFGRAVIHDHPSLGTLHASLTDRVSGLVNEAVEPCYNFLSLYNNLGVCGIHMDAPSAKWTVDYCVEQSARWPIYLSQVRPWPEDWTGDGGDWQGAIRKDPRNRFSSYELEEGQAIVFGGSSQWHYRDRIEQKSEQNFCHLVFFHFIPRGTRELTRPEGWAALFDIPELSGIVI
jgi:hypothetical protein